MRALLSLTGCLVALLMPALIHAQGADDYPSRPVTIVIANAAGGASDNDIRIWMARLAENLGQQFVLEYKPGAGQTIAMSFLARQKPDGHYIGIFSANMPLIRLRYPDAGLDPVNGFEQISVLHRRDGLLAVHASVPIANIKEYVAYARAKPGVLNFSTSGHASIDHISGAWLMSATHTVGAMSFIHYKTSVSAHADLISGRVHMTSIPYGITGPFVTLVKTGKLRNIGTTSAQRSNMAPDVPTLQEQGVADYDLPSFNGLMAPPNTPAAIINKLYGAIVTVSRLPQFQQQLGESNVIVAGTPAEARRLIFTQEDRYRKLGQELSIDYRENY